MQIQFKEMKKMDASVKLLTAFIPGQRLTVLLSVLMLLALVSREVRAEKKIEFAWNQNKVNQAGIPLMKTPPVIDGNLSEGEWDGAMSFTGFMTPPNPNRQPYVQPELIQPTVYVGYDRENVYMAFCSPLPPKAETASERIRKMLNKSWKTGLKSEGKIHDDFLEMGDYWMLDIVDGAGRNPSRDQIHYKIMVNPSGIMSDYRTTPEDRGTNRAKAGVEWESKAIVKSSITEKYWIVEMAIPANSFDENSRPKPGTSWRVLIRRGRGQDSYDTSASEWNAAVGFFMESQAGLFLFSENIPAFHLEKLGPLRTEGQLAPACRIVNGTDMARETKIRIAVESIDQVLHEEVKTIRLAPGEKKTLDYKAYQTVFPKDCSGRVVVDAQSGTDMLYHASIQTKKLQKDEYGKIASLGVWPFEYPSMDEWDLNCANYPYFKTMDVWVDLSANYLPDEIRLARKCRISLYNIDSDKVIKEDEFPIDIKSFKGKLTWTALDLPDGKYQLRGIIYNSAGATVGKTATHDFIRKVFPWEHNTIGISDKVYPPFEPIKTDKVNKTMTIWGKTYSAGNCGLPGKIVSTKDMEIPELTIFGGTSLSVEAGGVKQDFSGTSELTNAEPGIVKIDGNGTAANLKVNVKSTLRYEGWYEVDMTVAPEKPVKIDGLKLTFSYGNYPDVFFLTWDRAREFYSAIPEAKGKIWENINPGDQKNKDCYFVPVVAIGNGDVSLWWYANGDENWKLDYGKPSQSIIRTDAGVDYEVMLVNHPVVVDKPLKFKFAVQVSPAKPFPKNRRAMEWGGQKRIHDTAGYGYWGNGIDSITPGTDDKYALLKKGIDKWIAEEKSKKDMPAEAFLPVILYNSGELLGQGMEEYESFSGEWKGETPAPVNAEFIDSDIHTMVKYHDMQQDWRSQPKRLGPTKADLTQSSVDCRIWYYKKNMEKLGINGYWFDNASLWPGENVSTGRAYLTEEGKLRPCYPTFERHEIFRRLFVLYMEAGKEPFFMLNGHTSFCFSPWRWFIEGPAYIYKHNGTIFDTLERNYEFDIISRISGADKVKQDPIAVHRGIIRLKRFMGSWNPKGAAGSVKGTRSIVGMSLLHDFGIEFRIDNHAQVKEMLSKIGFFKPELEYLPYWRNDNYLELKPGGIKCSIYRNSSDKSLIAVLVNPTDKDIQTSVSLKLAAFGMNKPTFSDPENLKGLSGEQKGTDLQLRLNVPCKEYRLIYCNDVK